MTAILEPPTVTQREQPPAVPASVEQPTIAAAPAITPRRVPAPAVQASPAPRTPAARPVRARRPILPALGIRILGCLLLALFVVAVQVEPPADGPQPVLPGWAALLTTANVIALYAAAAGFVLGRRWALPAGLAFGGLTLTSALLCPALGHHQIAGWWYAQLGIAVAMVLLPAAVLAGTRAQPADSSAS